jgi:RNA polymerase-binding transcription factor DksA
MLDRTRENLNKVKEMLLRRQQKVEADLKSLEKTDPLMDRGLAESSEPGTDSWVAETHGRVEAMRNNLRSILESIRRALVNLNSGKYGKCESCHKVIEAERLEAMPTATFCIACSSKTSSK